MIYFILFYLFITVFSVRGISYALLVKKKGQQGSVALIVLIIISFLSPVITYIINH